MHLIMLILQYCVCNFLKEQISVILVACVYGDISNIFIRDMAEGTAIDRLSNRLYSSKIPLILSPTTDVN